MAMQFSVAVRNARLDAIETTTGTSAKLQLRTGAPPANCAATAIGTLICEIACPSDYLANATAGAKVKAGTWAGTAVAAGVVGHYRFVDSAGTTCHTQGTATITGGGGDMELDNTNVAIGQAITVNSYTITDGNA